MNILVIGEGGREHAIVKTLKKSPKCEKIFALPGNAGMAQDAECKNIPVRDFENILLFIKQNNIDLVVVGPEVPLALGIADYLNENGVRVFGPSKLAAEIEASKVFAKNLMKKYNIPTAPFEVFDDYNKALEYIKSKNEYPIVIKADGLAAGKGVLIPKNLDEAQSALKEIMVDKVFGDAGNFVVIEKFLSGIEMSILAFTDGKTVVPMVSAKDYKKIGEDDTGLNTGGMGAISPNPIYTKDDAEYCFKNIFIPTIKAMENENRKFKGVLYFGMIKTESGIYVIEYNCRFGDPETQVILPRLKADLVDIFNAVIDEKLNEIHIEWTDDVAMTIVLASGGYPKEYQKGYEIKNLDKVENDIIIFHAGTKSTDNKIVTNGGRVLNVTCVGKSFDIIKPKILSACNIIDFENKYFRKDIGK